jgi:hypothetical protein
MFPFGAWLGTKIMGVIVDLYPALPRRRYFAQPQNVEAERPQGARRRFASVKANAPLGCLSGGALASRFHAWHGGSGERYVFTVYPVDHRDLSAGLPDLDNAVVIAVAFDGRGERVRVAIFEAGWGDGRRVRGGGAIDAALAAGAREWHVHLLAASSEARRSVIRDLESG